MKWMAPLLAMVVIGLLEAFAIHRGINGTLFSISVAAIGGLGGYTLRGLKAEEHKKSDK